MQFDRRPVLAGLAALVADVSAPGARAQGTWPDRPIRLVVPYPPGQSADIIARLMVDDLRQALGQPIVIENRGGAGGTIGTDYVAHAPADGYTLAVAAGGPVGIAPSVYPRLGYDPVRDLDAVVLIAASPQMFVVPANSPIRSIPDLIAAARLRPGGVFFGSSGSGSTQHLAVELFATMAGVQLTHVPYRGSGPALNDLVAGQLGLVADTLPAVTDLVRNDQLRAIGVTSAQRMPFFPDVPTIAEQGIAGYESTGWLGVVGPKGIPENVLARLEAAFTRVIQLPEFQRRLAAMAFPPSFKPRAEFAAFIPAEVEKWRRVVEAAGVKLD